MQAKMETGASGGGASHAEAGWAISGSYHAPSTKVSNDGEFTLGNWGNTSVTILKACTVIIRSYNQTQTSRAAVIGETINLSAGGTVMLVE